jgi:hypothetical protein
LRSKSLEGQFQNAPYASSRSGGARYNFEPLGSGQLGGASIYILVCSDRRGEAD